MNNGGGPSPKVATPPGHPPPPSNRRLLNRHRHGCNGIEAGKATIGEEETGGNQDSRTASFADHASISDGAKARSLRRNRSPAPIHFVGRHRPAPDSRRAPAASRTPITNKLHKITCAKSSSALYWSKNGVDNDEEDQELTSVYPGIPFQVAKYLCESNPELVERMEAALHVSVGGTPVSPASSASTSTMELDHNPRHHTSPLDHMAFATDALALQQSVIGATVRQPQPDVVPHLTSSDGGHGHENPLDQQCAVESSSSSSSKELLRFPKDRITTLVERRSWFSAGGKEEELSAVSPTTSQPNSNGHQLAGDIKWPDQADQSGCSVTSESELESNFSERSSSIAMDHLDMGRSQFGQSDEGQRLLDVLREKAALEGQLEIVKLEAERSRAEAARLQSQLATARAQVGAQAALSRASSQEVENMRRMLDDSARRLNVSEDLAVGLREALDAKAIEVIQSRSEALEAESEARALRIALQETKVDAESRDGAVVGLKAKVAEMHGALEEASRGRSHAECELQACRRECDSESKMKEWYRQQVEKVQEARQTMQRDVLMATADAAEARASAQRLRFEGERTSKQLADVQQRAVREKENLLRHLETIEADVQEREAAVQLHLNQLEGVGDGGALVQRIRAVEEERARLAEEAFSRTQLEHQLDVARKELADRAESQARTEHEAAALASRVVVLQNTVDDGRLELNAACERYTRLEGKCRELESSLHQGDELVSTLRREKRSLEVELSAAKKERCDVDSALVEVQANVAKLDGRIRRLRDELMDKTRSLDSLAHQKTRLEDELAVRESALDQRRRRETRLEEELKQLRDEFRRLERSKSNCNSSLVMDADDTEKKTTGDDHEEAARNEVGCQTEAEVVAEPEVQAEDAVDRTTQQKQEETSERRRMNSTIGLLTRKLKAAKDTNKKLEADLRAAVGIEPPSLSAYRTEVDVIEKKLEETQRLYEEEKRRADRNQTLLIDAEKEKGRLHALTEGTEALRLHTGVLEASLAERENQVRALETLAADSAERNRRDLHTKDQRLEEVEKKFGLEQSTNRDLRRQVFKEMCETKGLRKNLLNTKELLEETGRHLEASRARVRTMEDEATATGSIVAQLRVERNDLEAQLQKTSGQVESLRKELEECRAKDDMFADQIKSLGWHLHQKNQELGSLQAELKAVEERHAAELDAAREGAAKFKRESEIVAAELQACSKEKFAYQARVKALKASAATPDSCAMSVDRLIESPTPYNESLVASLLQQSLRSLPESRRPLSHLRLCLDTLKQEMAILQRQLLDND